MIRSQLFIAVALLAGVAIGYFTAGAPTSSADGESAPVERKTISDKGEDASIKALRRRIAELERMLAAKDGKSEIAISNAVAEAVQSRPPEPPRQNWRERMEEMKKNDPERYTQMTNRFAQWRRSRSEQARDKIDFLSSIDISRMSAGAKKTHNALQERIARREGIEQQLQSPDLTDEERGKLMGELHSTHHELMRLNGEERNTMAQILLDYIGFHSDCKVEIRSLKVLRELFS